MICAFIGCDRDAGDRWFCKTHQKQLARRKDPDLMTPIGVPVEDVPPCRRCGGRDFSIKGQAGRRCFRYCLPCHAAQVRGWRRRNPEAYRAASRKYRHTNLLEVRRLDRERKRAVRLSKRCSTTREIVNEDIHFKTLYAGSCTSLTPRPASGRTCSATISEAAEKPPVFDYGVCVS